VEHLEVKPLALEVHTLDAARQVLDRFEVGPRLQHIREFVWRGGSLRLDAGLTSGGAPDVFYELAAEWQAPVLEGERSSMALDTTRGTVIEGRWTRGRAGYRLRVGIDLDVPSAIYVRSGERSSFVPFLGRPTDEVAHGVATDLAAYAAWFLSVSLPVPQAMAQARAQLQQLGLAG
jgi:hypothetical protein